MAGPIFETFRKVFIKNVFVACKKPKHGGVGVKCPWLILIQKEKDNISSSMKLKFHG